MARGKSAGADAPAEPEVDTTAAAPAVPSDPLDAPAEPEVERPAPELDPQPDPLTLVLDDEGNVTEVVMFNPLPVPLEAAYNGRSARVRPKGFDLVPILAANNAVGPDNMGGPLHLTGLRRLYGPHKNYDEAAKAAGLSPDAFAALRNADILAESHTFAEKYIAANPLLAELEANG